MSDWKPSVRRVTQGDQAELKAVRALVRADKYDEALAKLRVLLEQNAQNVNALLFVGYIHYRKGAFADAAKWLEKGRELDPISPRANLLLGTAYLRAGEHDKALTAFDSALHADPNADRAFLGKALVLLNTGRQREAAAVLHDALRRNPQWAQARLLRARALMALDDRAGAEAELRQALRDTNQPGRVYLRLARLHLQADAYDEARADLAHAIEANPNSEAARVLLGRIAQRQEAWAEARDAYTEALRLKPDLVGARVQLVDVLLKLGEVEAADQHVRSFPKLKRFQSLLLKLQGDVHYHAGRAKEAMEAYRAALLRVPETEALVAQMDAEADGDGGEAQLADLLDELQSSVSELVLGEVERLRAERRQQRAPA